MSFGVTRGASTNGSAENQGDGDAPLPKTRMAPWTAARDNSWQMVETPTLEELASLRQALADALKHNESLAGELRVTRTERDLLKEQLNKFKRQLFAASSEVTGEHQKDLFFNEAERGGAGNPDTAISGYPAISMRAKGPRRQDHHEQKTPQEPLTVV